jgi:hypothetical protein
MQVCKVWDAMFLVFCQLAAGCPSIHDVAKGCESLLLADKILALASSIVRLDLVGAAGIELKAVLKMRKLLIPLNG